MRIIVHVNPPSDGPRGLLIEVDGVLFSCYRVILDDGDFGMPMGRALAGPVVRRDQLQGEVHEFASDVAAVAWMCRDRRHLH